MIGKPDIGNGVVVMDRAEYATKMKVILNDQSKFKAVHKDNYFKNLVKFQRFLSRLKAKSAISRVSNRTVNPNEQFHVGEPEPNLNQQNFTSVNLNPQNCAQVNPNRT